MILEKKIPLKYWIRLIKWQVLILIVFSISVFWVSQNVIEINIPITFAGFLGTSIALLLSFLLSQSYDRWWEARKVWGAIVNDSRSFVLQLNKFTKGRTPERVKDMTMAQVAWCYTLAYSLRGIEEWSFLSSYLEAEDNSYVMSSRNKALAIQKLLNDKLKQLRTSEFISEYQSIQLDNTVLRFVNSMGMLERIKKTIFPKTYRVTLQIFIYMFLIILTLSLTGLDSWIEIPILILISIPFFLLERISKKIQNPFENEPTDTPMLAISRTIEINLLQLIDHPELPDDYPTNDFYLE